MEGRSLVMLARRRVDGFSNKRQRRPLRIDELSSAARAAGESLGETLRTGTTHDSRLRQYPRYERLTPACSLSSALEPHTATRPDSRTYARCEMFNAATAFCSTSRTAASES